FFGLPGFVILASAICVSAGNLGLSGLVSLSLRSSSWRLALSKFSYGWLMEERSDFNVTSMTEEINDLLDRLKFLEEESTQVIYNIDTHSACGFKSWAVGKIMATEIPNREAMYRVFISLWFTKEEVDFVACLFSMLPFEKGKEIESYEFWWSPFWLRIYNFPLELMDRQMALDVGNALGELVAIYWKDRNGGWTEFVRIKVKINVLKPLRRVVKLLDKEGTEVIGVIKYERLPDFCYVCGLIGHSSKTCKHNKEGSPLNESNLQYGSWMRAPIVIPNQDRNIRRNGVELVNSKTQMNNDKEESQSDSRGESEQLGWKGKERLGEEDQCHPPLWKKGTIKLCGTGWEGVRVNERDTGI
ncbi:hypothetical protein Gorai_007810, partial [Gossypium raimondii]|nr:hypothetical protein [Gossypium raimondii]